MINKTNIKKLNPGAKLTLDQNEISFEKFEGLSVLISGHPDGETEKGLIYISTEYFLKKAVFIEENTNQPNPSPENQLYTVGSEIQIKQNLHLKILAYSENYYMARIKGRIPFCCTENELTKKLEEWRR